MILIKNGEKCIKAGRGYRNDYNRADDLVTIKMKENRFRFKIESTGALRPQDIFLQAINILSTKLEDVENGRRLLDNLTY